MIFFKYLWHRLGCLKLHNENYPNRRGKRSYELSNHLGNVLAVVSDKKIPQAVGLLIDYYEVEYISVSDYYPFGMQITERSASFTTNTYRYGFNGMENDNNVSENSGDYLDFGARIYNSRLGRWLALDPEMQTSPSHSPYNAFSNNPMFFVDPDGKKIKPSSDYSQEQIHNALVKVFKSTDVIFDLFTYNGNNGNPKFGLIELSDNMKIEQQDNLSEKQFKKLIKNVGKENKQKFNRKERALAYDWYKVINSQNTTEILVTQASGKVDNRGLDIATGDEGGTTIKGKHTYVSSVISALHNAEDNAKYLIPVLNDDYSDLGDPAMLEYNSDLVLRNRANVLIGEAGGDGISMSSDGRAVLIDNTAYDKDIGKSGDSAPLLNSAVQTVANQPQNQPQP